MLLPALHVQSHWQGGFLSFSHQAFKHKDNYRKPKGNLTSVAPDLDPAPAAHLPPPCCTQPSMTKTPMILILFLLVSACGSLPCVEDCSTIGVLGVTSTPPSFAKRENSSGAFDESGNRSDDEHGADTELEFFDSTNKAVDGFVCCDASPCVTPPTCLLHDLHTCDDMLEFEDACNEHPVGVLVKGHAFHDPLMEHCVADLGNHIDEFPSHSKLWSFVEAAPFLQLWFVWGCCCISIWQHWH